MIRRLAAVPAALALTAFSAAVVLGLTVQLHQGTNIAWNDPGVEVECETLPASGMVLWHFVAHTSTSDFTMDATFADGTIVTDQAPDSVTDSFELQWNVTTVLTTLNSASITGSGTVNPGGFNLSHVCPNPGVVIPEAPASMLLVVSAAILGVGFIGWKKRQGASVA
ncbi:MAG: hypothetical protein ACRDGD_04480 [Candidatus Limnocylindria bacterium]